MADFEMIIERGCIHDDIVLDLYNTLLLVKNDIFNRLIERSKEGWDIDTD